MQVTAAIIGAGPLGIEMAAAFKKVGVSHVLLDKGQAAQMIANFPAQTRFFSSAEKIAIAGIPIQTMDQQKCTREDYLAYLRAVIMHYGLQVNAYEEVIRLSHRPAAPFPYRLDTATPSTARHYDCRYLVIASGGTSTPRLLGVPGESLPHVSIKMQDPHTYFQRRVVVIGAKNSAVESALRCYHAGAKVALVMRKEQLDPQEVKYWLLPEIQGCIAKGDIACYPQSEVVDISPGKMTLRKAGEAEPMVIEADFVIKALGFEAEMGLLEQLHVPLLGEQRRPIYDPGTMETASAGAFVLGTVVGGTQRKYRVFIENCHEHVNKIARVICVREGLVMPEPLFIQRASDGGGSARLEE